MQGKTVDFSLERRSDPVPRPDDRGFSRSFQSHYWETWDQCIP